MEAHSNYEECNWDGTVNNFPSDDEAGWGTDDESGSKSNEGEDVVLLEALKASMFHRAD